MNSAGLVKRELIFQKDNGIYSYLSRLKNRKPEESLDKIIVSGLRGRGGAGFATGDKWKIAASIKSDCKYVVCNCDEGEPGTFKDREILLRVPEKVLLGMVICAHAIGSNHGIIYLRREYHFLKKLLDHEIQKFYHELERFNIDFKIEIIMGAGAYVCGEETALLQSMEGRRGEPRNKPPFPVVSGHHQFPTVINNVETLATVSLIEEIGAEEFMKMGTRFSVGTKLFSISGDTPKPGVYEIDLGMKLSDFVREYGDGDTKAVQVGGASGFCVPQKLFEETIIGFEGVPTGGAMMLFNSSRSMFHTLCNYLDFFSEESCGQCSPCRIGCQQLKQGIKLVKRGVRDERYLEQLVSLSKQMKISSKCGLGRSVGNSFSSIVEHFREEMLY